MKPARYLFGFSASCRPRFITRGRWLPGFVVLFFCLVASPGPDAQAQIPGSLDAGFTPSVNGVSALVLQADGKIVIGGGGPDGGFSQVNGTPRNNVARLNADGSLDPGFDPGGGVVGNVDATVILANGRILLGGNFSSVGTSHPDLVRLNADGSVDPGFNAGDGAVPGGVEAIAVQADGKLVLGGTFGSFGGVSLRGVGRVNADGTSDTGFQPPTRDIVNFLASAVVVQPDGKVLVGGGGVLTGFAPANGLVRLNPDGSVDAGFHPDLVGASVRAISLQPDGRIIVGGVFTKIEGATRRGVARLNADGSLDRSFDPGSGVAGGHTVGAFPGGYVSTLTLQADGKVVLGGNFTEFNGAAHSYLARLNPDGSLDAEFDAQSDHDVWKVTLQPDGKVLLIGDFTRVNGEPRPGIARLNVGLAVPVFTGAGSASGQVGQAFLYQIVASNSPASFRANGLPAGLSLETSTGLIHGTPTQAGTFQVALGATNSGGAGAGTLMLTVAPAPPTTVSIRVDAPAISRGNGQVATVTLTRTGDLSRKITVAYTVGGSLIGGNDYVTLGGTKKIKAGRASASFTVQPLPGGANGKVKLVVVSGPGYLVDSGAKVWVKVTD